MEDQEKSMLPEQVSRAIERAVGDAPLTIEEVAAGANGVIQALGIASVVNCLDVPTIRYYRRTAVGVLSPPATSMGGYSSLHVLEALAARLGGDTMTTTLAQSAVVLRRVRKAKDPEGDLIAYVADLVRRSRAMLVPPVPPSALSQPNSTVASPSLSWFLPGGGLLVLPSGFRLHAGNRDEIMSIVASALDTL